MSATTRTHPRSPFDAGRKPRTLLEQLLRERRQSLEEFAEFAEDFARQHGEVGTISVRHLKRLAAGRGANGRPLGRPRPATARLLERIFDRSIDELLAEHERPNPASEVSALGLTAVDHDLAPAFDWIDRNAGWSADTSRKRAQIRIESEVCIRPPGRQHGAAPRSQLVRALAEYYGDVPAGYGRYAARVGSRQVDTSILTRTEWLDLGCPLASANFQLSLDSEEPTPLGFGAMSAGPALDRLVDAAVADTRITDLPLYRLLDIDVRAEQVTGQLGITRFVDYALTLDLLERELLVAIPAAVPAKPGALCLRDHYLPDVASVLDLRGRLCAGGVLGLCAIARPADAYRPEPDYALIVQQRSGLVVNAVGCLAVIPKAFHRPLVDYRTDTNVALTLRRELEEELFQRGDVDDSLGLPRAADPMHPDRLSEPMRWLDAVRGRMTMECTGFGLNLVSGNYEVAALIRINDEEFWTRYGGQLEANWESAGIRVYSGRDPELLAELVDDEMWSNEGLFAFVEGLRRLGELDSRRVEVPTVSSGLC
jgi:hypothetical protein